MSVPLFFGKNSLQQRTRLANFIESILMFCKIEVIFQSWYKLNSFFRYKYFFIKRFTVTLFIDLRELTARLLVIPKFTTIFYQSGRANGYFNLTGRCLESVKQSAVSDYLPERKCAIYFRYFYFSSLWRKPIQTFFKKSLFIKRDQLQLNKITIPFP